MTPVLSFYKDVQVTRVVLSVPTQIILTMEISMTQAAACQVSTKIRLKWATWAAGWAALRWAVTPTSTSTA